MSVLCGTGERESLPVTRYAARGTRHLTGAERRAAVAGYAAARVGMSCFEAAVREGLASVDLGFVNRRAVLNLCRGVYRVAGRAGSADLEARLAPVVERAARLGVGPKPARVVLRVCLRALDVELDDRTLGRIARKAREAMKSETEHERTAHAVRETVATPRPAFDIGVSAGDLLAGESVLDEVRRDNALAGLRAAIAGQRPVVKTVVVRRLLEGAPVDELARQVSLSRDEVQGILARLRERVAQFTCYFESDWYWRDETPGGVNTVGAD